MAKIRKFEFSTRWVNTLIADYECIRSRAYFLSIHIMSHFSSLCRNFWPKQSAFSSPLRSPFTFFEILDRKFVKERFDIGIIILFLGFYLLAKSWFEGAWRARGGGVGCVWVTGPSLWSACRIEKQNHHPGLRKKCSTWLVETENAFSSRRIIFYSARLRQIERQKWLHLFGEHFHEIDHICWSSTCFLMRIVQNKDEILSFRMVTLPGLGKFCGVSCAPPKVSWHDQNLVVSCSYACMFEPDEFQAWHLPWSARIRKEYYMARRNWECFLVSKSNTL